MDLNGPLSLLELYWDIGESVLRKDQFCVFTVVLAATFVRGSYVASQQLDCAEALLNYQYKGGTYDCAI